MTSIRRRANSSLRHCASIQLDSLHRVMNARLLFTVALVAAICIVGVQSHADTKPQVRRDGSSFFDDPHPLTTGANIDDKWAKINADLKARNYSRPASPNGGVLGVDVSAWAGQDTWSCILGQGYTFAIVSGTNRPALVGHACSVTIEQSLS